MKTIINRLWQLKGTLPTRLSVLFPLFSSGTKSLGLITRMNISTSKNGSKPGIVAVTQMTSTGDKESNFNTCVNLVQKAAFAGAQMVFLPEGCDYISESSEDALHMSESLGGTLITKFSQLAVDYGVWLSLGGVHIKENHELKGTNLHIIIDNSGSIVSTYAKTHLFSVFIPESNLHLQESNYVSSGTTVQPPVSTPVGNVAMMICYDLRFPELSIIQRRLGAQILTFPSAFTVPTGLSHWETLLRARAIDTQCYVIAAAQTGQHNKKRSSFGHAMIIDPWGAVVAQTSEGTNMALAEINLDYIEKVRKQMPVMDHRRNDLYSLSECSQPQESPSRLCQIIPPPSRYVNYQFGEVSVPGGCVFLKSQLSQAFVNRKPVANGHVLVTPERPAKRLSDLTPAEVSDLAQLAQKVQEVVMKEHSCQSSQVTLQDGKDAGQTIQHVHLHVLPYQELNSNSLQGHDTVPTIRWREDAEMVQEATQLRQVVAAMSYKLSAMPSQVPRPLEIKPLGNQDIYHIGEIIVPGCLMVMKTLFSCAFVARDPVLSGHVYVTFLNPLRRLCEATPGQVTDLFLTIQLIQRYVEAVKHTHSSTVVVMEPRQETGQVVHAHVIPRVKGDLLHNDDIYKAVHVHHNGPNSRGKVTEQLVNYAENLRGLIH